MANGTVDASTSFRRAQKQSTIRGRWESPAVFHRVTGERLIVDADDRARWDLSGLQPLKPYWWDALNVASDERQAFAETAATWSSIERLRPI